MKYIIIIFLTLNLLADHNHFIPKDLTHLNLSESQYEKIKEILKSYQYEMKTFREKKRKVINKKKSLFLKDDLNMDSLTKLDLELTKEFSKIKLNLLSQIHTILTKKQREKFLHYMGEWDED